MRGEVLLKFASCRPRVLRINAGLKRLAEKVNPLRGGDMRKPLLLSFATSRDLRKLPGRGLFLCVAAFASGSTRRPREGARNESSFRRGGTYRYVLWGFPRFHSKLSGQNWEARPGRQQRQPRKLSSLFGQFNSCLGKPILKPSNSATNPPLAQHHLPSSNTLCLASQERPKYSVSFS